LLPHHNYADIPQIPHETHTTIGKTIPHPSGGTITLVTRQKQKYATPPPLSHENPFFGKKFVGDTLSRAIEGGGARNF